MNNEKESKGGSWPRRKPRLSLQQSFGCAFRGLAFVIRTQRNARIHLVLALVAVGLGVAVRLSLLEWALLCLVIVLVFAAEVMNTAIELLVDLASPGYHETARAAKDAAAGAVLCLSLAAVVVGLILFGPPLLQWLWGGFPGE